MRSQSCCRELEGKYLENFENRKFKSLSQSFLKKLSDSLCGTYHGIRLPVSCFRIADILGTDQANRKENACCLCHLYREHFSFVLHRFPVWISDVLQ